MGKPLVISSITQSLCGVNLFFSTIRVEELNNDEIIKWWEQKQIQEPEHGGRKKSKKNRKNGKKSRKRGKKKSRKTGKKNSRKRKTIKSRK